MRCLSALVLSLALHGAQARHAKRQQGPVDPETVKDCTFYDEAIDESYDCAHFERLYDITHSQFVTWNPSVKNDCSGIKVGNSYCVESPTEPTTPTTTSNPTTTTTTPTGPSPTQDGIISTCVRFHKAESGDTCQTVVDKYGTFSFDQFMLWNTAVTADCGGFWLGYYYCVGVPGTPTTKPTQSPTPTGPSPTQTGIISTCNRYHKAESGDSCSTIVDKYGTFPLNKFVEWNPAVKEDCSGLWLGYYYCIGIPGTPTQKPTTTKTPTPTGPSPTQTGIISTCNRWHKAESGNSCSTIVDKYGTFTLEKFIQWNPAVKADCSGLWVGYHYCIGIPGTPTTKPTPTPTGCTSPGLPSPTQPGGICKCKQWHKVASGDNCATIQTKYKISAADFNKWNPEVGKDCKTLWLGYYVCVKG
ncbi:hypothetical protein FQN57_003433 [Myotisia sp. PD_48]|nr:hypothetical protein FQN57_003433 [Myotisia sp. PD_48]